MTSVSNKASQEVWIFPKFHPLAHEAHEDAELNQQILQDMNAPHNFQLTLQLSNVAPELSPASTIILDCSSDFVKESKHTCGALRSPFHVACDTDLCSIS